MRAAIYKNKATNFAKLLNITLDLEEMKQAGVDWPAGPSAPVFIWYEKGQERVGFAFSKSKLPSTKTVVDQRSSVQDIRTVALQKMATPIKGKDQGRTVSFMLHTLGVDPALEVFSRQPIACKAGNGQIFLYVSDVREAGDKATAAAAVSGLHTPPAAAAPPPPPVVPDASTAAAPLPVAPQQPLDLNKFMELAQQFLDVNPKLKITTVGRKVAIVAA